MVGVDNLVGLQDSKFLEFRSLHFRFFNLSIIIIIKIIIIIIIIIKQDPNPYPLGLSFTK